MTREQCDELFLKVGTMQLDELEKIIVDSARKADVLQTNADRIRGMTDEELAHLLHTAEEHLFSGNLWNYEQWRKWLKSPVEVDE